MRVPSGVHDPEAVSEAVVEDEPVCEGDCVPDGCLHAVWLGVSVAELLSVLLGEAVLLGVEYGGGSTASVDDTALLCV